MTKNRQIKSRIS